MAEGRAESLGGRTKAGNVDDAAAFFDSLGLSHEVTTNGEGG